MPTAVSIRAAAARKRSFDTPFDASRFDAPCLDDLDLEASERAYDRRFHPVAYLAVGEPTSPSVEEILGRFSDARCLLECALHSLSARDDSHAGIETVCLRHGLELLRDVYNDLDLALLRRSPEYGVGNTGLAAADRPGPRRP